MKRNFLKTLLCVTTVTSILFTCTVFAEDIDKNSQNNMEYLDSIMNTIKENYNYDVSDRQLIEGALKGMFNTMDSYTQYLTNEEAESFYNSVEGNFEGLGMLLGKSNEYVMVIKVYPSSPAEKVGIFPGDRIVSVNGKRVIGGTPEDTSKLVRGQRGKKVELEILRGLGSKTIKISSNVANVEISPVEYEVRQGVGYIRLDSFSEKADEYVVKALKDMDCKNLNKVVFDLRDNPGGYAEIAVEIAKNFVPKGLITKLDFKSDRISDTEYRSSLEKMKYKLAVLVNGNSASASEIFAGAVQDTGAGTLIGTKTYGKARVQNVIPILTPEAFAKYKNILGTKSVDALQLREHGITPEEDEIMGYSKITTGIYTTPKGRMIDKEGLTPDIVIPDPTSVNGINVNGIERLRVKEKPGLNDTSYDIFSAELILKLLGYSVDDADSKLDKKTFEAIKKYQKAKGGKPYGKLDFTTQKWLNDDLDKLLVKYDKQYAKALEVLKK